MIPALSQAITLSTPFEADILGLSDGGCRQVEVWLTKLEQYLEKHSLEETLSLLASRDVKLVAAAFQGGLLTSQGDARAAHFDHFKKRLAICESLAIPTMILVADYPPRPDQTTIERSLVSLKQAAQWAAGFNVDLALEFQATSSFCNCLDTAITLVEQSDEPNLGICLDAFHYTKGPSKPEDLARLTCGNLKHVQLCDVPGVLRELMTDADRVFPGEGDFHLSPIVQRLGEIGYDRAVSVEVLNPVLWDLKPSQVSELAMTALTRYLGA
ncbi:MAG: sugar phosphate isomerase/epimerase family protein [Fimbriiglobus sp.]